MRVDRAVVLPVPLEEAWRTLLAWERQADWMLDADEVRVVSSRREGVGVRLEARTRVLGVPAFTEPIEVTAWDPPRRLEIRHGSLVVGTGTWTLEPVEGGTWFGWTEEFRLAVPIVGAAVAVLYGPVLGWLMGRAMSGLRGFLIATGPARS